MTKEVSAILKRAGVANHLRGYQYVGEAVTLVAEDRERLFGITKVLYSDVAKKFNTTNSSVERGIRWAIEYAFNNLSPDVIEELFGNTVSFYKDRPTNSQFIAVLADFVIEEREEGKK